MAAAAVGARGEQGDGVVVGQRRQRKGLLAVDAERPLAGGEHPHPGSGVEHLRDRVRDGVDEVLAVVQHEQQVGAAQPGDPGAAGQRLRERGGQLLGGPHAFQPHQPRAVGRGPPARGLDGEARLTHPCGSDQRDESVLVERGADGGQLRAAADQRGGGRGQVAPRRAAERRIVHEHLVRQVGQRRAGVDAQLVGEHPGDAAVRGECVRRAPRPVQGRDQQRPQPLAQRVFRHQRFELPDQLARRPEREPRGELVLGQPQPHLGEPHPVRRHPVAVARGREDLGVEQLQARAADGGRGGGVALGEPGRALGGQARRVQRVDGVGDERVARRAARHGRRVAQRPAQLRHLDLQRVRPGAAGPEVLGEPRRPYGATALEREPDQQLRGAPRRHRGRHPVAADDDAPEHRHGQHGAHGSGAGEPRELQQCHPAATG